MLYFARFKYPAPSVWRQSDAVEKRWSLPTISPYEWFYRYSSGVNKVRRKDVNPKLCFVFCFLIFQVYFSFSMVKVISDENSPLVSYPFFTSLEFTMLSELMIAVRFGLILLKWIRRNFVIYGKRARSYPLEFRQSVIKHLKDWKWITEIKMFKAGAEGEAGVGMTSDAWIWVERGSQLEVWRWSRGGGSESVLFQTLKLVSWPESAQFQALKLFVYCWYWRWGRCWYNFWPWVWVEWRSEPTKLLMWSLRWVEVGIVAGIGRISDIAVLRLLLERQFKNV